MDNLIGKKLDGRYEILQLIGVGGMANVYKARDVIDERLVAVKILREEYASNEEFVRRFKNESKAIAALNHPNIVKVYDVSFSDKMQSIVMEYIDGITLKEYIEQQGKRLYRPTENHPLERSGAFHGADSAGVAACPRQGNCPSGH